MSLHFYVQKYNLQNQLAFIPTETHSLSHPLHDCLIVINPHLYGGIFPRRKKILVLSPPRENFFWKQWKNRLRDFAFRKGKAPYKANHFLWEEVLKLLEEGKSPPTDSPLRELALPGYPSHWIWIPPFIPWPDLPPEVVPGTWIPWKDHFSLD